MKDEIKEILEDLLFTTTLPNASVKLSEEKLNQLKDYITNLEQENEKLKEQKEHLLIDLRGESEYKSRIDNAIEHIKQYSDCGGSIIDNKSVVEKIDKIYNGTQLLNLLTGGDKE